MNKIQKVIGYCGDREKVTADDIETMIDKPLEKSVFDMAMAVMEKIAA